MNNLSANDLSSVLGDLRSEWIEAAREEDEVLAAQKFQNILNKASPLEKEALANLALSDKKNMFFRAALESLVAKKENVDKNVGHSWLFTAVKTKNHDAVKTLLHFSVNKNLNINPRANNDDSFFWACHMGDKKVVELFLDYFGSAAQNVVLSQNRLALAMAIDNGNFGVVNLFIEKGFWDKNDTGDLSINAHQVLQKASPEFFDFLMTCPSVRPHFFDHCGLSVAATNGMIYEGRDDLVLHILEKSKDRKVFLASGTFLLKPKGQFANPKNDFYAKCAELLYQNNPQSVLVEAFLVERVKETLSETFAHRNLASEQILIKSLACLLPKDHLVEVFLKNISANNLTNFLPHFPKDTQNEVLQKIIDPQFPRSPDIENHPLVSGKRLRGNLEETSKTKHSRSRKTI